jgi:hypothetical protein
MRDHVCTAGSEAKGNFVSETAGGAGDENDCLARLRSCLCPCADRKDRRGDDDSHYEASKHDDPYSGSAGPAKMLGRV